MSISIELGDTEYELTATSVDFGQRPSRDDPGAGAEIELEDDVKVWGLVFQENGPGSGNGVPGVVKRIKLDEFVDLYADYNGIRKMFVRDTRAAARAQLEEYCIENLQQQLEDEYDDRDV